MFLVQQRVVKAVARRQRLPRRPIVRQARQMPRRGRVEAGRGGRKSLQKSVDLRLPDRITVRLPEGRSLEDVTSGGGDKLAQGKART